MKLRLGGEVDLYGVLEVIHNWLPLVVITAFILSKVSVVYRSYLFRVSQVSSLAPIELVQQMHQKPSQFTPL